MSTSLEPSPRISNRRIAALVLSIVLPVALFALGAVAITEPGTADHAVFWIIALSIIAGESIAIVAVIATGTEDRMQGRLDDNDAALAGLAGQIAALGETIQYYGDERESAGVVMGMRATAKATNVRQIHS